MSVSRSFWTAFFEALGRVRRNRAQRRAAAARRRCLKRQHAVDHLEQRVVLNADPVAADDALSAYEDSPTNGSVSAVDDDLDELAYYVVDGPQYGVVDMQSDGTYVYTPNEHYFGGDSFAFMANDGTADSNLATITIDVASINDAPIVNMPFADYLPTITSDIADGDNRGLLISDLMTAALSDGRWVDYDDDLMGLAVTNLSPDGIVPAGEWQFSTDDGANWTAVPWSVSASGLGLALEGDSYTRLRFSPASNMHGVSAVNFHLWDATSGAVNGTVVDIVNHYGSDVDGYSIGWGRLELQVEGTFVIDEDSSLEGVVQAAGLTLVDDVVSGSLTLNGDGTFTYTPDQDFNGEDSFSYEYLDFYGVTQSGSVTITVQAVNDAPTSPAGATVDLATISEDETDAEGTLVRDLLRQLPVSEETLTSEAIFAERYRAYHDDGTIGSFDVNFDPGPFGYSGYGYLKLTPDDETTYGSGFVADIPDESLLVFRNELGWAAVKIVPVEHAGGQYFAVMPVGDAGLDFTNSLGWSNENVDFDVWIVDSSSSVYGTLLTALTGSFDDVDADALQGIALVGSDETNGIWEYSLDDGASWTSVGSVSESAALLLATDDVTRVRFNPSADFNGTANFTFRLWDQTDGLENGAFSDIAATGGITAYSTESATAYQRVAPVNDAPVFETDPGDATYSINLGEIVDDTLPPALDIDGDSLTYALADAPTQGTAVVNSDGTFTYTPFETALVSDSFTYTVADGNGGVISGTITIELEADEFYDEYVDMYNDYEGGSTFEMILTLEDDEYDLDHYGVAPTDQSVLDNDSAVLERHYEVFHEQWVRTIHHRIRGGVDEIIGEEDDPVETTSETLVEEIAADLTAEGDTTYEPLLGKTSPAWTVNYNGTFVYEQEVPDKTPVAEDRFGVIVTATVSYGGTVYTGWDKTVVTLNEGPNEPPTAVEDGYEVTISSLNEDPFTFNASQGVLANDSDADGDEISVEEQTDLPTDQGGKVTLHADGSFDYTPPPPPFTGVDTFTYTVIDRYGATNTAVASVTVYPPTPPSVLMYGGMPTNEGETAVIIPVMLAYPFGDYTYSIDWGDGTVEDGTVERGTTPPSTLEHVYVDDDPTATPYDVYPVSLTVTDAYNQFMLTFTPVTVINVAPEIWLNEYQTDIFEADGTVTVTGYVTDQGENDDIRVWIVGPDDEILFDDYVQTGGTFEFSITPDDDDFDPEDDEDDGPTGHFNFTIHAVDHDGGVANTVNGTIDVHNVDPTDHTGGDLGFFPCDEGGPSDDDIKDAVDAVDPGSDRLIKEIGEHTLLFTWHDETGFYEEYSVTVSVRDDDSSPSVDVEVTYAIVHPIEWVLVSTEMVDWYIDDEDYDVVFSAEDDYYDLDEDGLVVDPGSILDNDSATLYKSYTYHEIWRDYYELTVICTLEVLDDRYEDDDVEWIISDEEVGPIDPTAAPGIGPDYAKSSPAWTVNSDGTFVYEQDIEEYDGPLDDWFTAEITATYGEETWTVETIVWLIAPEIEDPEVDLDVDVNNDGDMDQEDDDAENVDPGRECEVGDFVELKIVDTDLPSGGELKIHYDGMFELYSDSEGINYIASGSIVSPGTVYAKAISGGTGTVRLEYTKGEQSATDVCMITATETYFVSVLDEETQENEGPLVFGIEVRNGSGEVVDKAVRVTFRLEDDDAVVDEDYEEPEELTIDVGPGTENPDGIPITLINDWKIEPDEKFRIVLTEVRVLESEENNTIELPAEIQDGSGTAEGTIKNDDKPRFTVSRGYGFEGTEDDENYVTFYVELWDDIDDDVTLSWMTVGGSAEENHDYEGAADSLTFTGGSTKGTVLSIDVRVYGDDLAEGDEEFDLEIDGQGSAFFLPEEWTQEDEDAIQSGSGSEENPPPDLVANYTATGTIEDEDQLEDDGGSCNECACAAMCLRAAYEAISNATGNVLNKVALGLADPLGAGVRLINSVLNNPHSTVTLDLNVPAGVTMFQVELTLSTGAFDEYGDLTTGDLPRDEWLDLRSQVAYFDASGFSGSSMRVNIMVDARAPDDLADLAPGGYLATGLYGWRATVIGLDSTGQAVTDERVTSGAVAIVNELDSPVGNRWSIDGLDRLIVPAAVHLLGEVEGRVGDILFVSGDGTPVTFRNNGDGTYQSPAGNFSTLTRVAEGENVGGFILEGKQGRRDEFDSQGYLIHRYDQNGNLTTYAYSDTDGYPALGELFSRKRLDVITDGLGRTTTFTYVDDHLDSITDYVGRVSEFEFDGDKLTKITSATTGESNPTPSTPQEYHFDYDESGRLSKRTDPNGNTTEFAFNGSNRVETVTRRDAQGNVRAPEQYVTAASMSGFANPLTGVGDSPTTAVAGIALGSRSTQTTVGSGGSARTTSMELDRLGNATQVDDAAGGSTSLQRNRSGLATQVSYDPDGEGSGEAETTEYDYDARGNMTRAEYGDGSYETWLYDSSEEMLRYDVVLEHRDRFGRVTSYTYDSRGNMTEERLHGSGSYADVWTTYVYTETGSGTLGGLLLSVTDEAGTTAYEYYIMSDGAGAAGQVKSVTTGYGTSEAATTNYVYDSFGRLIRVTAPDPDDGGPQDAPITVYRYDELDRVTDVIRVVGGVDGEGNSESDDLVTHTEYDAVTKKVASVTSPTPAGGTAYVVEYEYDDAGRLATMTERRGTTSAVTTYQYDENGNLIQEVGPDPDAEGPAAALMTLYAYDALNRMTQMTYVIGEADPEGAPVDDLVTSYEYDSRGRVSQEIDSLGSITRYTYDIFGRILTVTQAADTTDAAEIEYEYLSDGSYYITDAVGNRTYYGLDPLGRLAEVTDPTNRTSTIVYGAANRVASSTDFSGRTTTFDTYDVRGNVTQVTGPLSTVQSEYDKLGRKTAEIDPLGVRTEFLYDVLSRLTSVTRAVGTADEITVSYTYDALGRILIETDPAGNETHYEYDDEERTITTIVAPGTLLERTDIVQLDALGRTISIVEAFGTAVTRTTLYTYDEVGRTTSVVTADGTAEESTTLYEYDRGGNVTQITTNSGTASEATTVFEYDLLSRRTKTTDALGGIVEVTYDAGGAVLSTVDPLGRTVETVYDALRRPTSKTDSLNRMTTYAYDAAGRLVTVTAPDATVTRYEYDDLDRVTAQIDADGTSAEQRTEFTYDAAGRRTTLTDAVGNVTSWTYDDLGRMKTETITAEQYGYGYEFTRSWTYDARGLVTSYVDRNGRTTNYTYDVLGRKTSETYVEDDVTYDYEYDALDRLVYAGNAAAWYEYLYTALNQVSNTHFQTADGVDVVLSYTYDAAGNRQTLSTTVDGVADLTNSYVFDALHRLVSVVQSGTAAADKEVGYEYDAVGNVTEIARSSGTYSVTSTFDRDTMGRLTGLIHANGSGTLESYEWTFNSRNWVLSYQSIADGTVAYEYDDRGQLISVDRTGTTSDEEYVYDANGNRVSTDSSTSSDVLTVVTGLENRLLDDGVFTYEYDPEGNRTLRTRKSEDPAEDFTIEYRWDQRNRLTGLTYKNELGDVTKRIEYQYDVFNRRIEKEIFDASDTSLFLERYVFDGEQTLFDLNGTNDVIRRYLYGAGIDEVLAVEEGAETYWLLADSQGSIRQVADSTGAVVGTLKYDAFGLLLNATGCLPRFTYNGTDYDADTGMNLMGRRWYDPAAQRWISADPIQDESGQFNYYVYVDNGATYLTDPSGLAVGHHYFPQNLVNDFAKEFLTPEAILVASGYTTGDLGYDKDGKSIAGQNHPEYDEELRRLFKEYARGKGGAISGQDMKSFIDDIAQRKNPLNGADWGDTKNDITDYLDNKVKKNIKKDVKDLVSEDICKIMKRGATAEYSDRLDDAIKHSKEFIDAASKANPRVAKRLLKGAGAVAKKFGWIGAAWCVLSNGGDPKAIASDITGQPPEKIDAFLKNPLGVSLSPGLTRTPVPQATIRDHGGVGLTIFPGNSIFDVNLQTGERTLKGKIQSIYPTSTEGKYDIQLDTGLMYNGVTNLMHLR